MLLEVGSYSEDGDSWHDQNLGNCWGKPGFDAQRKIIGYMVEKDIKVCGRSERDEEQRERRKSSGLVEDRPPSMAWQHVVIQ